VLGRGEWVMNRERWPIEEYEPVTDQFKAERFRPEEWVALAKGAGMKYLVCTSKHHDGFCLFDSKLTDYTAVHRGPGRDLMAELAQACHAGGLKLGFYYSLKDWHHPDYEAGHKGDAEGHERFLEYIHGQARELCANYGELAIMWYDGGGLYDGEGWKADEMNAMVRELQPGIVINDRSRVPEDYDTPEQHIRASAAGRAWETCMTMNANWGWHAGDNGWKSTRDLIITLARVTSMGGNLLLNVGPRPDGTFPPEAVERLEQIGDWMAVNAESVQGARRGPYEWGLFGFPTVKGSTVYLHVVRWQGPELIVGSIRNHVKSATLLATGQELTVEQKQDRLWLRGLPGLPPDPYDTVIKLELEGEPEAYPRWL
jgi:alpha-L-fucosidase